MNEKKILFIILESESASGICVKKVSAYLCQHGYHVDLLVQECGIEHKEKTKYTTKYVQAKLFDRYSKNIKNPFLKKTFEYAYSFQVALTSLVMWPMNSPLYAIKLSRLITSLYEKEHYDIIIPVYTQIEPMVATFNLKKKYNNILYIPYFLDSLSGGPVPRLLSKNKKIKMGLKWEKKLLSKADGIIAMKSSENHHKRYSSNFEYFKKMCFLDIPLYTDLHIEKKNNKSKELIITYIGTLPMQIRNPMWGLKLLDEISNIKVKMVGPIPNSDEYVEFCKNKPYIQLVGAVKYEDTLDYIQESDVLLNFGNNISEMVPSKIFEYISSKKPILSFSPNRDDPSIGYLQKYPYACTIFKDMDRKLAITTMLEFLSNIDNIDQSINIDEQFYLNTPEAFRKYIEKVIKDCGND